MLRTCAFAALVGCVAILAAGCASLPSSSETATKPRAQVMTGQQLRDDGRARAAIARPPARSAYLEAGRLFGAQTQSTPPSLKNLRRHFGPFYRGSELSQINIWLHGSSASWHYGSYFNDLENGAAGRARYALYQPGGSLPAALPLPTAAAPQTAGLWPASDGPNRVLLRGAEISYSSRYGGTVRFTFEQQEDVEVELRRANRLWDTRMRVHFYLPPRGGQFNNSVFAAIPEIHIEIEPNVVQAYELETPGTGGTAAGMTPRLVPVEPASVAAELDAALELARAALLARRIDAYRFMYGFLQDQFPDLIPTNVLVNVVTMSDGLFETATQPGTPTFSMSARATDIRWWPEDATLIASIVAPVELTSGTSAFLNEHNAYVDLSRRSYMPYGTLGIFPLSVCTVFRSIDLHVSFDEESAGFTKTSFNAFRVTLDCAALQQAAAPGAPPIWGVPMTQSFDDVTLRNIEGTPVGIANIEFTVQLWLR
jgi:hypothetical protein